MTVYDEPVPVDWVTGDATGLQIPAHLGALLSAGPEFLTRAFRTFGSISSDNAVTTIVRCDPCPGGSTGHKFFLTLDYARAEPRLERTLFLKFSRDFGDARRDFQRSEMAGEAKIVALSRDPGFPLRVPNGYFADYHTESGTGLVITERIEFGAHEIEPHRTKCRDHLTMADPLPYYRAQITALARLAGADKAGRPAPDLADRFPFGPEGSADPIRQNEAEIRAQLETCKAFARDCRSLLPEKVTTPEFLRQFEADVLLIQAHEAEIQRELAANSDLIALCHWNANIDNLFFWREAGELKCGMIDWGRAGRLTFGSVLWGGLCAAHHDIWTFHLPELLRLFVAEYSSAGGPTIDPAELDRHLALHMAAMGTARMLVAPETIRFRLPEIAQITHRDDPRLMANDPAKNYLHTWINLLSHWQRRRIGTEIQSLIDQKSAA